MKLTHHEYNDACCCELCTEYRSRPPKEPPPDWRIVTDIVERLRAAVSLGAGRSSDERAMMNDAADEIVRLRDENAALKAELDRITPVLNYLLDGN